MKLQVGTKKVKDILIDQKIPTPIRENLILLASRDKVLWIPTIKKSLQDKSCSKKLYVYEVK
jgi:tRNA(Ile)-lysidine synthetase-like protein